MHKDTHQAAAIAAAGQILGDPGFPATNRGHRYLPEWLPPATQQAVTLRDDDLDRWCHRPIDASSTARVVWRVGLDSLSTAATSWSATIGR